MSDPTIPPDLARAIKELEKKVAKLERQVAILRWRGEQP